MTGAGDMRAPLRALILLALSTLSALGPCRAHESSESYAEVEIDGAKAEIILSVTARDAARVMARQDLAQHVADHVALDRGGPCAKDAARDLGLTGAGARRVAVTFTCPGAGAIALRIDVLRDVVAAHVTLARIAVDGAEPVSAAFGGSLAVWRLDPEGSRARAPPSLSRYALLGFEHIFLGLDHVLFLWGLVILHGASRRLIWAVTGFTLGHSLALAVVAGGLFRPPGTLGDALVGLTIALVGLDIALDRGARPGTAALVAAALPLAILMGALADVTRIGVLGAAGMTLMTLAYAGLSERGAAAARLRLVATALFGLIHGLGFAKGLIVAGLDPGRLAGAILSFNLGVEAGQLAALAAALAMIWLAARSGLGARGGLRARGGLGAGDLGAGAACAACAFYGALLFVQKTFI